VSINSDLWSASFSQGKGLAEFPPLKAKPNKKSNNLYSARELSLLLIVHQGCYYLQRSISHYQTYNYLIPFSVQDQTSFVARFAYLSVIALAD
jgi:hypothetical protein